MKILLVEDEPALRKAIETGLKRFGYAVDAAADGETAVEMCFVNYYDAMILDLNLPKLDGVGVLKQVRKFNSDIKILILSARSGIDDIVDGLDLGANDYMTKPFNFRVLEARLSALLRRKFMQEQKIIEMGGIRLDLSRKTVSFGNTVIPFTKKEYSILEYLMLNRERVISNEELFEHAWDSDGNLFSNSLKVHLNSVKKKLWKISGKRDFIKNKRGHGYYVLWD